MPVRLFRLLPAAGALLLAGPAAPAATASAPAAVPPALATFLEQHCVECHDADVQKGGLDLQSLRFDLGSQAGFARWVKVFERVHAGEMPPAKQPRPAETERAAFLAGLQQPLAAADVADIATHGRVRSRRLTRLEYEHTLHDLLGIDIPLKDLLPEDRASHGFETVAEGQQLSHHQLGRYLDVADRALEEAWRRAFGKEKAYHAHHTPEALGQFTRGNFRGPETRGDESRSWPMGLQFTGRMKCTEVPQDGWYCITLRGVRALNPGRDGAVWGTLRSGTCASNAPLLHMIGLVEATAQPRDITFTAWMQKDHMLELRPNDGTLKRAPTGAQGGNISYKDRDLEKDGYAGIAHRGIEVERIHTGADRAGVWRCLFDEVSFKTAPEGTLERLVRRFATRAFRRPVTPEQAAPYEAIARQAVEEGRPLPEALRAAYRAILCSPRFLTLVETPGTLDDHALAARLSYALWLSLPDAALTQVADAGRLHEPEVLRVEIERLLAHPRATRFIHSFTDQWLKLAQIDFTNPDPRQFPTFDPVVQESMLQETRAYFAELLRADLSVTHLVASDFAFLNGRLLRHYQGDTESQKKAANSPKGKAANRESAAPACQVAKKEKGGKAKPAGQGGAGSTAGGPLASAPANAWAQRLIVSELSPGAGLQKATLAAGAPRGGLITQGAVLKVTADGSSTSPVVRGVFINERILGVAIPPPPPGIPAIEPDIRGATSIREQLAKHRSHESCASCHRTIDPPGFALESFDPVGGWRARYGQGGKGVPVDPSGTTPDGSAFADLAAWQGMHAARPAQLARGFAAQFLTYATGAAPRFSDSPALEAVVRESAAGGHGLRSVIVQALLSPVFGTK